MLDQFSSQRLSLLRFPLVVGVVFIHAYDANVGLAGQIVGVGQGDAVSDFVRNFISQGLARISVPLFFLMSGYLFFLNLNDTAGYLSKLKSRVQTLLIPFLFWNCATLLLVAVAQDLPETKAFFSGKHEPVLAYSFFQCVDAVLGMTQLPISYQFWFIRDLMVLIVMVPVLQYFYRFQPALLVALAFLGWVFNWWPVVFPSAEATLFFSIGGIAAIRGKSLFAFDAVGSGFLAAYLPILVGSTILFGTPAGAVLHKAGIMVGVVAALSATKLLLRWPGGSSALIALSGASFFVFAAHEPLLTISKKIAYKLLSPSTTLSVLALYILIPIALVFLLVGIHRALLRLVPNLVVTVTGGR